MEKLRLKIHGADEDIPRLLLAYGKACGGKVGFVVRPRENTAFLVHHIAGTSTRVWRTTLGLAPSHAPELDVDPDAAAAELNKMRAVPPAGPATLRGTWRGVLECDERAPRVTLERKVATYGVLRLVSKPDGRWSATFDRAGKWFGKAKQESVERSGLADAITAGMWLVIGLVSEACSFRDTRRRNAVDADYGAQHPYKPPREPKDPTTRFDSVARKAKKGAWTHYAVGQDDDGNLIEAFREVEKPDAKVRAALKTLSFRFDAKAGDTVSILTAPWDGWPVGAVVVVRHTDERGAYLHDPVGAALPTVPELGDIPAPRTPGSDAGVARAVPAIEAEAQALADGADSVWGSEQTRDILVRAGKLIRHAEVLVLSPRCTGKEQRIAQEDLKRAMAAYAQARDAIQRGENPDVVKTLRRIAERVSLAAARAGKSCAAGQQKLDLAPPAPERARRARKPKASDVDPEKDKLLVDAFAAAIQQAAQQMSAGTRETCPVPPARVRRFA